jgi:hypothetical protein
VRHGCVYGVIDPKICRKLVCSGEQTPVGQRTLFNEVDLKLRERSILLRSASLTYFKCRMKKGAETKGYEGRLIFASEEHETIKRQLMEKGFMIYTTFHYAAQLWWTTSACPAQGSQ